MTQITMTQVENGAFMNTTFMYVQQLRKRLESGKITDDQYEKYCDKLIEWEYTAHERTEWE